MQTTILLPAKVEINATLTDCLSTNAKTCCIFGGIAPSLKTPVFLLARMTDKVEPKGLVEVPFDLQFVIISLTPESKDARQASENGRLFGAFLTHKVEFFYTNNFVILNCLAISGGLYKNKGCNKSKRSLQNLSEAYNCPNSRECGPRCKCSRNHVLLVKPL